MTAKRLWGRVVGAMILAAALSCGRDVPVAPRSAPPNRDLLGWGFGTSGMSLLQCSPLAPDSVTQVIGPDGGSLQVGPHTLTVPAGALDGPVAITAIAPSDTVNRVHFEPHGLQFTGTVSLTMSYANCGGAGDLLPKSVVFTTPSLNIVQILPSLDDVLNQRVTGQIRHFSDYAVAW